MTELDIDSLGEEETWRVYESIADLDSEEFLMIKNGIEIKFSIEAWLRKEGIWFKTKEGHVVFAINGRYIAHKTEHVYDEMRLRVRLMKEKLREYYDQDKLIRRREK